MGLNVYRGPLFSKVEKSLKHNIGGSEGKKGMDTSMVMWRRVEYGDTRQVGEQKYPRLTTGRKLAFSGEVTSVGLARKRQKIGIVGDGGCCIIASQTTMTIIS
jgi:hypothetical protein